MNQTADQQKFRIMLQFSLKLLKTVEKNKTKTIEQRNESIEGTILLSKNLIKDIMYFSPLYKT